MCKHTTAHLQQARELGVPERYVLLIRSARADAHALQRMGTRLDAMRLLSRLNMLWCICTPVPPARCCIIRVRRGQLQAPVLGSPTAGPCSSGPAPLGCFGGVGPKSRAQPESERQAGREAGKLDSMGEVRR